MKQERARASDAPAGELGGHVAEVRAGQTRTASHGDHPLPRGGLAHAEGARMTRRRRRTLPRPAGRLLRARTSGTATRAWSTAAHAQLDAARRSPAAPSSATGSPTSPPRSATCAARTSCCHEHRRRGRRNRDQGHPQVGLRGEGRPRDQAKIIVAAGDFHGRTTTTVGFSTTPTPGTGSARSRRGSSSVPTATWPLIEAASRPHRRRPHRADPGREWRDHPANGYLRGIRDLCTQQNVLFAADEIQAGLGRTGSTFACDHEGVVPDIYILGKALGGGIVPVSADRRRTRTSSACSAPASTAAPSAATRWRARWA